MDRLPSGGFAALVPEFSVSNLESSLRFWRDVLGFEIAYQRPENGFTYLERGRAQVMLDRINGHWDTAPLEPPLGRGINFQIIVEDVDPLLASLEKAGWPLFHDVHEAWYRAGREEVGNRQFLVQDPDGYLLRFSQSLGRRACA